MGWDAYAEPLDRHYRKPREEFLDEPARSVFRRAADEVAALCDGAVEAMLAEGGLDFRESGDELAKNTGRNVYEDGDRDEPWDWSPDLVRELAAKGWPPTDKAGEAAMHYWGARKFLDACAELGLGIRFSW